MDDVVYIFAMQRFALAEEVLLHLHPDSVIGQAALDQSCARVDKWLHLVAWVN